MKQVKIDGGPLAGSTIEIAASDRIGEYEEVLDEVLECIDIGWALLTDESRLSDFMVSPEEIDRINDRFGTSLEESGVTMLALGAAITKIRSIPKQ